MTCITVGVAGIWLQPDQRSEAAELLDVAGRRWGFTYVVTNDDGVGALAADGVIDLRRRQCSTAGRVIAGELLVNPASDPGDVSVLIDTLESSTGVGRIVSVRDDGVYLPDGTLAEPMPLAWLAASGNRGASGLCDGLVQVLDELEPAAGSGGSVDEAVAAADETIGRTRTAFVRPDAADLYRFELYLDADGSRGIVVRAAGADAQIAVGRLHLSDLREPDSSAAPDDSDSDSDSDGRAGP
jgi:hypothetical protein